MRVAALGDVVCICFKPSFYLIFLFAFQAEKEEQGVVAEKTTAKDAQPDQWATDSMPPPPMQAPSEVTDWATEAMAVPPALTGSSFMGGSAINQPPVTEDWSASADDWSTQAAPTQQQQQQPSASQWGGETENWG